MAGGKRKYKENAFTAKAESGTLKVKILRKDLRNSNAVPVTHGNVSAPLSGFLAATRATPSQQQKQQQQQQLLQQQHELQQRSPPKPRPNRKHVPIFYQQKATTMMMESSSSSTDESMAGGGLSQSMSTTSTVDYNESSTTSQDSGGGRFSSLLSGLHLDSNGGGGLPRPPPSNPLFSRNDSDGASSMFGSLLRQSFPSAQGPAPLGSFLHASNSSLHHNSSQGETASALHQLASSSSAYGSSLASLSSAARDMSNSSSNNSGSQSQHQQGYRFDPFTALQSAIDVHQATLSASSSHAPYQYPHERQSFQSSEHQQQSHSTYAARQDASMEGDDLGPPPSAPPAFAIQNSLMGGGIEMQPVIANVNTHNFDWSNGTGRPRSGSLPNILEGTQSSSGSSNGAAGKTSSSNSSAVPSASNVHMWKEV